MSLSDADLLMVQSITDRVRKDKAPIEPLLDIHNHQLAINRKRRTQLASELKALDRAIAMRELAIEKLTDDRKEKRW